MIKFDDEKVILLQKLIIESSGGTMGIRDINLLNSAIENIYQTFDGQELYPSKEEKRAHLAYSLITNHAFVDGNKRIGLLAMLSFFALNGIHLLYSDAELIDIGLKIASNNMNYDDLLLWIKQHEID